MLRIARALALLSLLLPAGLSAAIAQVQFPAAANTSALFNSAVIVQLDANGRGVPISASNPLQIAGNISASLSGFAPGSAYATLSSTASSANAALPAGLVAVAFNVGTTAVSCVIGTGAQTATADKNIIQPASWFAFTKGSNNNFACINEAGDGATNKVVLSGGSGLPTGAGGGSSGGGGGGAITMASASVSSGAYSSGSIASGAMVDLGAIADGAATAGGTGTVSAKLRLTTSQLNSIITALGSPFQAGGSIGNTSFGISGTLPAFAATPTFNLGTLNGAATAAKQPAIGTAGASSSDVISVQGVASMTPLLVNPGTAANWGVSTFGAAYPSVGTAIGVSDGTNMVSWLNAANSLNSTGLGLGTSQIIGQFDDVSPTSITENRFGNLRISQNRNLYGTIRDAAGNERGVNVTAANELLVNVNNTNANLATNADGIAAVAAGAAGAGSPVNAACYLFNGTTWDRCAGSTAGFKAVLQASSGVDIGKLTANQSVNHTQVAGTATSVNSGTVDAGTQRVVLPTNQPNIPVIAGNTSAVNTIAASQTAQVLSDTSGGGTGATGDYLSHCIIIPGTTSPGSFAILDNATSVFAFPGGASSVSSLVPIVIPIGSKSKSGAWKITNTTNVTGSCVGKFS